MQLQINLASRAYVNRRALYAFYLICGVSLVVLLAFNVNALIRLRAHAGDLTAQLAELAARAGSERANAGAEPGPAELEKRRREVAAANEILERDGFRWTALLDRLEGVAVDGISVRAIQPNFKENTLNLTANARDLRPMQNFLDNLLSSPSFSEVYLLNQSAIQGADEASGGEEIIFSVALKGVF